jgi:nucleoid DNA-binding protein
MQEFVREIAGRTGMPEDFARGFLKEFLTAIADTLGREGSVRLNDFGTFEVRRRAPRRCRNPRTGERMTTPARNHVAFKPAKLLLAQVDQKLTENFGRPALPSAREE